MKALGGMLKGFSSWGTLLIVGTMVAFSVFLYALSGSMMMPSLKVVATYGGNGAIFTMDGFGQWRLIAAKFILGSVFAFVLFLPFFVVISMRAERIFGAVFYVFAFLLLSILTSVGTLHSGDYQQLSRGALGPTLGFVLAVAILAVRQHGIKSLKAWRPNKAQAICGVLFCAFLAIGALDYFSMGLGLLGGLLIGLLYPIAANGQKLMVNALKCLPLLLVAGLAAGLYAQAPAPPFLYSDSKRLDAALMEAEREINAIADTRTRLVDAALYDSKSAGELALIIEKDVLPEMKSTRRYLEQLKLHPDLPNMKTYRLVMEMLLARIAADEALLLAWASDDPPDYVEAARRLEQWSKDIRKLQAAMDAQAAINAQKD